jgi:hypothetical protein
MKFICIFLVGLILFSETNAQKEDSVGIFLSPKDKFLKIDKSKISKTNNKYFSIKYNFSIEAPEKIPMLPSSDSNCIFTIVNDHTDLTFWINEYSNFYYSKEYTTKMLGNLNPFRKALRGYTLGMFELNTYKFLSDTIVGMKISGIPGYQYSINIKTTGATSENLTLIISQVFYKNFNYRLITVIKNDHKNSDLGVYLKDILLKSFKFLDTKN